MKKKTAKIYLSAIYCRHRCCIESHRSESILLGLRVILEFLLWMFAWLIILVFAPTIRCVNIFLHTTVTIHQTLAIKEEKIVFNYDFAFRYFSMCYFLLCFRHNFFFTFSIFYWWKLNLANALGGYAWACIIKQLLHRTHFRVILQIGLLKSWDLLLFRIPHSWKVKVF